MYYEIDCGILLQVEIFNRRAKKGKGKRHCEKQRDETISYMVQEFKRLLHLSYLSVGEVRNDNQSPFLASSLTLPCKLDISFQT